MIDFRTEKQIKRQKRNIEITDYFLELQKQNPDVPQTRIIKAMAKEGKHGLKSFIGIRTILVQTQAIHPQSRA